MPNLWGRQFSRAELMARVGDVSQVGGVREYRLDGGPGDGLPVVDVNTGSGLRFTVVPGRALDITGAWFNDIPLGFRAPAGEMHGAYYEPEGWGWVRSTVLGLLVTGGLDNVGDPAVEADRLFSDFGLHGRLSNLAASNVHADGEWQGDEYEMWVQGRVRQAALFGENLELKRRISSSLGSTSIRIHDEVTNLGSEPEPAMILFHVNPGYPLLDDGARLHVRSRSRRPYDDHSASLEPDWNTYGPPTPGWQNTVWIHDVEPDDDGLVHAALVNRSLGDGIGLGFTYPKAQLPFLNQWKFLGVGNYVTGIEPANCTVLGRAVNQADGTLQVLEPGETTEFDLELSVLSARTQSTLFSPQSVSDTCDHVETLRVRYSDTDAQGIVHHSNYFRWLEEARIGWLDAIGQPYGDLTQRGIFLPLTTCRCTFQAPVYAGEQVDVHLSLGEVTRARVGLTYQILRGDQVLATAATAHAYVDASGRPLRLTRDDPFWLSIKKEP